MFSYTVEAFDIPWEAFFFIITPAKSGIGSVVFFNNSQGGCYPQLDPVVITTKFHGASGVPFLASRVLFC